MGEKLIGCTGFILNHEIWAVCPVCGFEYDRRIWDDTCPKCAERKHKDITHNEGKPCR